MFTRLCVARARARVRGTLKIGAPNRNTLDAPINCRCLKRESYVKWRGVIEREFSQFLSFQVELKFQRSKEDLDGGPPASTLAGDTIYPRSHLHRSPGLQVDVITDNFNNALSERRRYRPGIISGAKGSAFRFSSYVMNGLLRSTVILISAE